MDRKNMAKVRLIFIPACSAGHLTSMLEFATRLLAAAANVDRISITVLLIKPPSRNFSPTSLSYIQSLSSSGLDIHFHHLPELDFHESIDGPEDLLSRYFQLYKHHVKAAVTSSAVPVSAIVMDFFATTLIDVANELSVPAYIYFTSPALMLGLTLHLPALDVKIPAEFEEVEGDVEVPGVVAMPANSMPTPWMDKKNRCYTWFVYHGRRFREAKGILVNTIDELEHDMLSALAEGRFVEGGPMPKIYAVGPVLLLRDGGDAKSGSGRGECIDWLDTQPPGSVVFLCFGSYGSFDPHQVREMAAGLERSGHRFLWTVRVLNDNGEQTDANLDELLPEGFLERTKERGLVWPSWAPQIGILSHGAVGGFVTHCGWNSCLESLWFGVPMLAWPLYSEQHMNAVEMVRDLGVAVGLKVDRKRGNFVAADELERGVRCLMGESDQGKRVRTKVKEMRLASRKAVEEGGSTNVNLKKLADDLYTSQGGVAMAQETINVVTL